MTKRKDKEELGFQEFLHLDLGGGPFISAILWKIHSYILHVFSSIGTQIIAVYNNYISLILWVSYAICVHYG